MTSPENPYEPPSSRLGPLNIPRSQNSWRRVGWLLVLSPPVGVIVLYLILKLWMLVLAASNPVPNQGAMVSAFLILLAAFAAGVVSILAGTVILANVRKE